MRPLFYGLLLMRYPVYSGRTGGHPVLVHDEEGVRTLRFGTEERQTAIDLREPWVLQLVYTQWMVTALLLHPRPQHFLVLGLGGGALPHFLLRHHPEARIDAVERERLIIDLAHDCFHLPRRDGLRILHQDALAFLRSHPPTGYHIAFVDIFGAGAMAPALFEPELYRLLMARMCPDGVLAVNLWSGDKAQYDLAVRAAGEGCGGRMLRMQVKKRSNVILLLFPEAIPHTMIKQARRRHAEYQRRYGIDFSPFLKRLRRGRSSLLDRLFG